MKIDLQIFRLIFLEKKLQLQNMIQQLLFAIITIAAFGFATKQFLKIRRNIFLGKDKDISEQPQLEALNEYDADNHIPLKSLKTNFAV